MEYKCKYFRHTLRYHHHVILDPIERAVYNEEILHLRVRFIIKNSHQKHHLGSQNFSQFLGEVNLASQPHTTHHYFHFISERSRHAQVFGFSQ